MSRFARKLQRAIGATGVLDRPTVWDVFKLGAGGFITGMDISDDGTTKVIRLDTFGANRWDGSAWKPLVTDVSMPAEDVLPASGFGCYEIAVAHSLSTRVYMAWRDSVYVSYTSGDVWLKTALTGKVWDGNGAYRTWGRKMVVDPVNPNVVYIGIPEDGVYATTDAGATWTYVSGIPVSDATGYNGMAFYKNSGTTSGKTKTLYVAVGGTGVYKTTNAGVSWSAIAGDTDIHNAEVSTTGDYITISGTAVKKYNGTSWSTLLAESDMHSIAIDPNDSQHLVAGQGGGSIRQSFDGGASWNVWHSATRTATDIPWLAWTNEDYMSNGMMLFDPVVPDKLWFAEGIGVWHTSPSQDIANGATAWVSQNTGIEQLVVNRIISPPGGDIVVATWDRATFTVQDPSQYPTHHGPDNNFNACWDLDYAATDSSFIVANNGNINWAWTNFTPGYSTDGGQTWTGFASKPEGATSTNDYGFGSMAVGDTNHIVWIGANSKWPYYTTNRGNTWLPVTIAGLDKSTADLGLFSWAPYFTKHIVAADKVNANTFYLFYAEIGSNGGGVYRSTDGGANWTRRSSTDYPAGDPLENAFSWAFYNVELQSVPGKAGHLFFTKGHSGNAPDSLVPDDACKLLHSTDGGLTWAVMPNVREPYKIGIGKAAPGASYPTIFMAGWVNNVYGVWRSIDEAQTWTKIGTYPNGSLDQINSIAGDMNTFGTVYIATGGSGAHYGHV